MDFNCIYLSCHVRVSEWIDTYSCLNVKELLARKRHDIWRLSDCNGTSTHHPLVLKPALNHLVKLVSLAKWLSVRLQPKWFQVRVSVLSLSGFSLLPLIQASLNLPPSECIEMYSFLDQFDATQKLILVTIYLGIQVGCLCLCQNSK